jgi:hypothetical protein
MAQSVLATGYGPDKRGPIWRSRRVKNFLFLRSSRPVLGPTQPPFQWVSRVKGPGCEADRSPPSSDRGQENVDICIHSLTRLHGIVLN